MTDDVALRTWIADHNHGSAFQQVYKTLVGPLGEWEASRGRETLSFDRLDEDGWISVSVFRRVTVAGKK